jgi:hypothetical protein
MLTEKFNITIKKYNASMADAWNHFVAESKNATFLFNRNYMDYHSDRFDDHSLMIYAGEELIALFPCNKTKDELISHGGLTYGGFLLSADSTIQHVIAAFQAVLNYCKENGMNKIYYKLIPIIYHKQPSQEDQYVLFRINAELYRRDIAQTIFLSEKGKYTKGRKWALSKAKKNELVIRQSTDFEQYTRIMDDNRKSKDRPPAVHSTKEIELLAGRFPQHIKLMAAYHNDKMVSGTLLFETDHTIHTQYIASSSEGMDLCAFDMIMDHLLRIYNDKRYFDFGISTEEGGWQLNTGLASFKESYGARGIVHDFYLIDIEKIPANFYLL